MNADLTAPVQSETFPPARAKSENERDGERWRWYMSDAPKSPHAMNEFLRGVREHWTLDQWRAWVDASMPPAP